MKLKIAETKKLHCNKLFFYKRKENVTTPIQHATILHKNQMEQYQPRTIKAGSIPPREMQETTTLQPRGHKEAYPHTRHLVGN